MIINTKNISSESIKFTLHKMMKLTKISVIFFSSIKKIILVRMKLDDQVLWLITSKMIQAK